MPSIDLPPSDSSGSTAMSTGLPDWLTTAAPGADRPLFAGLPMPGLPSDSADPAEALLANGADEGGNSAPMVPIVSDTTETPPPTRTPPPRGSLPQSEWRVVRLEVPHAPTEPS